MNVCAFGGFSIQLVGTSVPANCSAMHKVIAFIPPINRFWPTSVVSGVQELNMDALFCGTESQVVGSIGLNK